MISLFQCIIRRWPPGLLFLLAGVTGAAAPEEKFPGLGEKWHYYQSPNFEMYSGCDDADSREVLQHLELLRAVFLDSFKLTVRLAQPVTVFYFYKDRDFHSYWPPEYKDNANYVGFCFNEMDRSVISLAPSEGDFSRRTVYHEYIHYLFRITEQDPPAWYNEGMAELFSTIQERSGNVMLGLPIEASVGELRREELMPLEQLFGITHDSAVFKETEHTGLFYAESWAFLHYCHYGLSGLPRDRLSLFLRLAGQAKAQEHPERLRQACREILGLDYPQIMDRLHRYVMSGQFYTAKIPRPKTDAIQTYSVRPVSPDEMTVKLAELSCRITRSGMAKLRLLQALEQTPADSRLYETLGNDAWFEGDLDLARERWSKAVELGSTNPAVYRELVRLEADRWFNQFDPYFRLPEPQVVELRSLLQRSVACAPAQSSAYEIMAWVEATAAKPSVANINLVQHHLSTLNDKPRVLLALAWVRARLKDRTTALEVLDEVDKLQPDGWVAQVSRIIRASLAEPPAETPAGPP